MTGLVPNTVTYSSLLHSYALSQTVGAKSYGKSGISFNCSFYLTLSNRNRNSNNNNNNYSNNNNTNYNNTYFVKGTTVELTTETLF